MYSLLSREVQSFKFSTTADSKEGLHYTTKRQSKSLVVLVTCKSDDGTRNNSYRVPENPLLGAFFGLFEDETKYHLSEAALRAFKSVEATKE